MRSGEKAVVRGLRKSRRELWWLLLRQLAVLLWQLLLLYWIGLPRYRVLMRELSIRRVVVRCRRWMRRSKMEI